MNQEIYQARLGLASVSRAVEVENLSQIIKWGVQDHTLIYWLGILLEEVGEMAEAVMVQSPDLTPIEEGIIDKAYQLGLRAKAYIEGREPDGISRVNDAIHEIDLGKEIVQVAAVCVAMEENRRRQVSARVAA